MWIEAIIKILQEYINVIPSALIMTFSSVIFMGLFEAFLAKICFSSDNEMDTAPKEK